MASALQCQPSVTLPSIMRLTSCAAGLISEVRTNLFRQPGCKFNRRSSILAPPRHRHGTGHRVAELPANHPNTIRIASVALNLSSPVRCQRSSGASRGHGKEGVMFLVAPLSAKALFSITNQITKRSTPEYLV